MKKKISILLPAYNEEASMSLLHEKMLEVARTNPAYDWEFLIVNDGSRDRTLEIARQFHAEDPRFC